MTYPQKRMPAEGRAPTPARTHARGAVQVWVRMAERWTRVHATDDPEQAMRHVRDQIRHTAVERVEIRRLGDDGVTVLWSSE